MDLNSLGKWLVVAGLVVSLAGMLVWLLGKLGVPFGNLPGDIHLERRGFSFNFPVVTCIIVSIVLTEIVNLLLWFFRK